MVPDPSLAWRLFPGDCKASPWYSHDDVKNNQEKVLKSSLQSFHRGSTCNALRNIPIHRHMMMLEQTNDGLKHKAKRCRVELGQWPSCAWRPRVAA
eukprot:1503838-Amphidinium_carterae.1